MQLASVIVQLSLCFCEGSFVAICVEDSRRCVSISITLSAHAWSDMHRAHALGRLMYNYWYTIHLYS